MRTPLPSSLPASFTPRHAAQAGVGRSRLRGADLARPFRGVYVRRDDTGADDAREGILARARAAVTVLSPDAFLCHLTAAVLWGIPLPFGVTAERDLDIGVLHPNRPSRLAGVRGHRVQPHHVRVLAHPAAGLRVASPASTWAMLGAELGHPYDLIAAAEWLVSDRIYGRDAPLSGLEQLEAAAFSGRRVGITALRAALPRVRPHVASRTETWTRLSLVDAGLPEPEINLPVFDSRGRLLAIVDLAYPDLKIAIEYEGEHHLFDGTQWRHDIGRYERLAAAGWIVIRVTKTDLEASAHSLAQRVRSARASRR